MSMLTPRGAGSGPGRRRRSGAVRHGIVLVLAVLLLAGAGFSAWWFVLRAPDGSSAAVAPCPTPTVTVTPTVTPLPAAKVKVNVYNSTDRRGLAAQVAAELKKRGFSVLAVANDPKKKTVAGTAEVRYGPGGRQAAAAVRQLVEGATVVLDTRKDASVDLVLGQAFKALRTTAQASAAASPSSAAAPAVTASPTTSPTCTPVPAVTVTADSDLPGAGAGSGTPTRGAGSSAPASAKASPSKTSASR